MGLHGEVARLKRMHARRGRPRRGYHASVERREIKVLLAEGETIATIAGRLGISQRTVKARVADIYDSEGVTTRAAFLERVRAAT
jgi:DNA-binding NarL/FixJ family response regulator